MKIKINIKFLMDYKTKKQNKKEYYKNTKKIRRNGTTLKNKCNCILKKRD